MGIVALMDLSYVDRGTVFYQNKRFFMLMTSPKLCWQYDPLLSYTYFEYDRDLAITNK